MHSRKQFHSNIFYFAKNLKSLFVTREILRTFQLTNNSVNKGTLQLTPNSSGCPQIHVLKPEAPGTIHPFQENVRVKAKAGVLFAIVGCRILSG